jgi:hypothetical protein
MCYTFALQDPKNRIIEGKKMRKIQIVVLFFMLLMTSCAAASDQYQENSNNVPEIQPQAESPSLTNNNNSTVSGCHEINEKVKIVKRPMTYGKVVEILGIEGEVLNREPSYGQCPSFQLCPSVAYIWKFTGICSCELNVRFTNGILDGLGTNCID